MTDKQRIKAMRTWIRQRPESIKRLMEACPPGMMVKQKAGFPKIVPNSMGGRQPRWPAYHRRAGHHRHVDPNVHAGARGGVGRVRADRRGGGHAKGFEAEGLAWRGHS